MTIIPGGILMLSYRNARRVFFLSCFVLAGIFFQNCSNKGFEAVEMASLNVASEGAFAPQDPSTPTNVKDMCAGDTVCLAQSQEAQFILGKINPKPVPDCLNNFNVDTCLFFKNPVATRGSVFPVKVNNSMDLRGYQSLGLVMDPSTYERQTGCLKNSTYRVFTDVTMPSATSIAGQDACFPNLNFKVPYFNDTQFRFAAVMAHYYLNFQSSYMTEWTGRWYGANKNTSVFSYINSATFDNNAAFIGNSVTGTGAIVMGGFEQNMTPSNAVQESAISAEVYLHEAGHANIFYAINAIRDPQKNLVCGNSGTCCSSPDGCYGAINEGLADYHALILFPKHPSIGEAIMNSPSGIVELGLTRNYAQLRSLTPQAAYSAPTNMALRGEIHLTGRIWGSIWYEARLDAERKLGARGVRSIDRLFTAHLAALTGSDDFRTACQKTVVLARTVDEGLVQSIFSAECQRRGF